MAAISPVVHVDIATVNSIDFERADGRTVKNWIKLLVHCEVQKNGGVIAGAREWSVADWRNLFGFERAQTLENIITARLARWTEDGGLELRGYDAEGEAWRELRAAEQRPQKQAAGVASGVSRRAKRDGDDAPISGRLRALRTQNAKDDAPISPPNPAPSAELAERSIDRSQDPDPRRRISEGPPPPPDRRAAEAGAAAAGPAPRELPEPPAKGSPLGRFWYGYGKRDRQWLAATAHAFHMLAMSEREVDELLAFLERKRPNLSRNGWAHAPRPQDWLDRVWADELDGRRQDERRANEAAAAAERARLRAQPPQLAVIAGGDWPDVADVDPHALPTFEGLARELAEAKAVTP